MRKKPLAVLFALLVSTAITTAFAADVNQATEAELDGVRGIGPATTRLILAERQKDKFKSWADLMGRVKGINIKSAAKLSSNGLTVNDVTYPDAAEPSAAKK